MAKQYIKIRGANEHNLKHISLDIPRNELVVLTGLLFWTGGSAFMRAQLWPGCEFWYQVSLLGILLLPYAYYRFILAFGGEKSGIAGRIYFVVMLTCFWLNAQFGVFLEAPKIGRKKRSCSFCI